MFRYRLSAHVLRAFLGNWDSSFNVCHTSAGEIGLTLWDIHDLTRLPIVGHPYEEYCLTDEELYAINAEEKYTHWDHLRDLFDIYAHPVTEKKVVERPTVEDYPQITFNEWIAFFIDEEWRT